MDFYQGMFPFVTDEIVVGLKYFGFKLKPNSYKFAEGFWLIEKIEKRLKNWSLRWLSRAGRLFLIKSVLEAILVSWMWLSWIPKGILNKIKKTL